MPSLSDFDRLDDAPADDRAARLVLADFLKEQSDPRELILRAACAIHRQVAGVALPDRFDAFWVESGGWEAAAKGLEALAAAPEDTPAFRERYGRLLRGDVPLDPENLEATLDLQYDLQLRLLASLGLIEDGGITAVDGNRYLLPPYEDIVARMQTPEMQEKLREGFDTLLLVPFGLQLERCTDAWRQGLRRNATTLRGFGAFDEENPLWVMQEYANQPLVYDPQRFTADHGGRPKEQVIAEDGRGWDALLVEGSLANLPVFEDLTIGGRPQIECGRTPAEYLTELLRRGEEAWTPEAYIIAFLDALERRGQVLDTVTASLLPAAVLPTSRPVPSACWHSGIGRAGLSTSDPGVRDPYGGVRAAVRII